MRIVRTAHSTFGSARLRQTTSAQNTPSTSATVRTARPIVTLVRFMGVLPLQFPDGVGTETLRLDGSEIYDLPDLQSRLAPRETATLVIRRAHGQGAREDVPVRVRIDTPIEVDYYRHGGILPYVLRQLMR